MAEKNEVIRVDDIADDEERLIQLLKGKLKDTSRNITLDKDWTVGNDTKRVNSPLPERVDPSIPGLLLKKGGKDWGAVRVNTSPLLNEVSGPGQGTGVVMVVRKPDDTCTLYLHPSVRYFRYSS